MRGAFKGIILFRCVVALIRRGVAGGSVGVVVGDAGAPSKFLQGFSMFVRPFGQAQDGQGVFIGSVGKAEYDPLRPLLNALLLLLLLSVAERGRPTPWEAYTCLGRMKMRYITPELICLCSQGFDSAQRVCVCVYVCVCVCDWGYTLVYIE